MASMTKSQEHYPRAPITEAVIELRYATSINDAICSAISKSFKKHYMHSAIAKEFDVLRVQELAAKSQLNLLQSNPPFINQYRHASGDETERFLLSPNSVVGAQLAPYPGWSQFFERFKRDLKIVAQKAPVRKYTRIGVRYINRIDIPATAKVVRHEDYVLAYAQYPDALGPALWFNSTAILPIIEINGKASIAAAHVPSPLANHFGVSLDIDVFIDGDIPQNPLELEELLGRMRDAKNKLFEACVTDSARELFRS